MSENIKILLFDTDDTSKVLLESYIKELVFDCSLSKFNELEEELIPNDNTKKVIIVNLTPNNNETLLKIKKLSENKNNYFIIISYEKSEDLHVKAIRFGAKELLYKPVLKADFIYAIQQFYRKEIVKNTERKSANISILLSTDKGCGKTFTALNLAKEIADISKENTLLIDFNNNLNDISSRLNIQFEYSTPYIIDNSQKPDFIIKSKVHQYKKSNLYIMGTGVFRYNYKFDPKIFGKFLYKVQNEFRYIVADTNAEMTMENEELVKKARNIFFVEEPELSMFDGLITRFNLLLEDKRTKIILNKYSKNKQEKLLEKLIETIGKNIYIKIPKNHIATSSSIAHFQTLKELSPNLDLVEAYKKIAQDIIKKA